MAITVADNFSYQGKKPLDGRDTFATLAAMKAYAEASVYDGCLSYCDEDGKRYEFKSTNTVDPTTGKWREYSSGGGGQTYNDFTGATASTAGAHGLVPAPLAGDEGKVLFGNGSWGALPSVDLSSLSAEAFIFSETEKAVGQHTNGKLLYAKTIVANNVSMPNGTNVACGQLPSGREFATILNFTVENSSLPFINSSWLGVFIDASGNIQAKQSFSQTTATCNVKTVVLYTKTTDSPLPSGVKFAGVTSSGEVIYRTDIAMSGTVIDGNTWTTIPNAPSGVKCVIDGKFNNTTSGTMWGAYFNIDGGAIKAKAFDTPYSFTPNKLTLYYTLST